MNLDKRGQLTIFVIVGIVIVVGVIGYYVYGASADDRYFNEGTNSDDINNIKEYLIACLEYSSQASLDVVQTQGGYYNSPLRYEEIDEDIFLPYYTYEGTTYFPSIDSIEAELAAAMDQNVGQCVTAVEVTGYDLSFSSVHTTVDVRDTEVEFIVDMPVIVETEGHRKILSMDDYPVVLPSKLKGMHNVAQYYVDDLSDDNEYCVNCLAEVAQSNKVYIDIIPIDPVTSGVIISDLDTVDDSNATYYMFFNKFVEGTFDEQPVVSSFDNL